jgi:hypothetical protein
MTGGCGIRAIAPVADHFPGAAIVAVDPGAVGCGDSDKTAWPGVC